MFKKTVPFLLIGLMLASQVALAARKSTTNPMLQTVALTSMELNGLALHATFLGCVHSEHDCEHAAHRRGYHHHWTQYEHYRCGHHHVACYAE